MTTNGTAATWRATLPVPFAVKGITIACALAVAGCESGPSLISGNNTPQINVAQPVAAATKTVSIPPVLGVPEATSKLMVSELGKGLDKSRFTITASPLTPADYTLRGYATASKDKGVSKLSYFFDVIDKSGQKVNRIAGEEPLTVVAGKDLWQAVTPQTSQLAATKTAASFAAWAPAGPASGSPPAAGVPMAAVGAPAATTAAPVKAAANPAEVSAATLAAARPAGPATGSIDRNDVVTAVVPVVAGAPGDGSQALAAALQRELSRNGVALSDSAPGQAYRVEGKVTVGADKDGKQPIEIAWNVKDPQGKKLGTVTQKNEIPQGSLDGAWGKTADAAAGAAAQGILKLLPLPQKSAAAQ